MTDVRPATTADAAGIAALEALAFGPEAWSQELVLVEVTAPLRHALVVGDEPLGWASVQVVGDVADLTRVAVRPDARRRGLARRLLADAWSVAEEAGSDRMLLEVGASNDAAIGLYAAAGFVEIDRRHGYYAGGGTAIVMERRRDGGTS
ncbi:hypothetical protein GCM10009821_07880 [Aeromicrobium halocynthiae]|uniref:N-acetyltransferase domain-containing protein n=1 Tax=Aeromicrobium halocynthiae TaxID=560557 RepID=A0ABN2VVM9_9ACTN